MKNTAQELIQAKRRALFELWGSMHREFEISTEQEERFLKALAGADLKSCCALVEEIETGVWV